MRLFRLSNRNRQGCWVFAETVERAKTIFLEAGRVKKLENIKFVEDQTDFYRDSTDLRYVEVEGTACIKGPLRTWTVTYGGRVVKS